MKQRNKTNPYDSRQAETHVVEFISIPADDAIYEELALAYSENIKANYGAKSNSAYFSIEPLSTPL